jgi:hypothetical protein
MAAPAWVRSALALVSAGLCGCGAQTTPASTGEDASAAGRDADTGGPELDAGDGAGDELPAREAGPPTPTPTLTYLGGPVLSAPEIVTVTFANDDPVLVARLQQFGDTITSTAWWRAVSSEYCVQPAGAPCVGPGAGRGHVALPTAAASAYTDSGRGGDSTIRQLLQAGVADGTLPAPDAQTVYVLYFPAATLVRIDGNQACTPGGLSGFHDTLSFVRPDAGAAVDAAYVVVPRCSSTEQATTVIASHEIVEAATDPSPENAPSYQMTDPAWQAFGSEAGDVCAMVDGAFTTEESGFAVQRTWSNASAAAGHDPCVPAPPGQVYFNVAPEQGTSRIALAVGQSATITVYPFADGPTSPWPLLANDTSGTPLTLTLSSATATPGAPVTLTVLLASKPPFGGDLLYGLVSQSGLATHAWPLLVHPL